MMHKLLENDIQKLFWETSYEKQFL